MATPDLEFATKCLVPSKGEHVIPRRRLIDLLHKQIDKRVQTLSAPAGYGKTTLLTDFAAELEAPVCWYSIDASDQDASQLVEGIVYSIRRNFAEFGQATLNRLYSARETTQEMRQIVGTLTGEMYETIPDFFTLILDDFHNIEDSLSARGMLNLLIERAPENCHIVIASRTPVDLSALHKLKLQDLAANLSTNDLAFAPAEVRDLLGKHHGLNLTEQEAGTLATRTEGWIVGILLSGYSLRGGQPNDQIFSLSHEDVFRYLGGEVYLKQPVKIREFLLSSSTLETIEAEACDVLLRTTDARLMLKEVEKRSLFIQCVDEKRGCFRYHALFREFLQRTLIQENRALFVSLHAQAALSAEQDNRWQDAIGHYLAASRYTQAKALIARAGQEYVKAGKWSTVARWIEGLPETVWSADQDVILLYSQSLIHLGENGKAAGLLTQALSHVSTDGDWLFRSQALSWRSAALRITGHFVEARNDIEQSIALLTENNGAPDILGDAYRRLGNIFLDQGMFTRALVPFDQALKLFSSQLEIGQMAELHNYIGILYKRLGQLNQAFTHFELAREGWLETKNYGALAMTLVNVGYIYQRFGQFSLALDTIENGIEKARRTGYRRAEGCLLIGKAEILRDLDRYDEALDSYNLGLDIAREVMESYYVIWAKAGLGETYRLLGDMDKAEVLVKEAISQADTKGHGYDSTLFTTQLGVIEYERGHYLEAEDILQDVCIRLEGLGDKDGLAKGLFHRAQNAFLDKKYAQAMAYLKQASDMADELGYDAFLAVEGRKAVLLMEYAVAEGLSVERFSRTVDKIKLHRIESDKIHHTANPSVSPRRPEIEARALGQSSVLLDSQPVSEAQWRSLRAKEILFYLLSSDMAQTKENITTAVWPDLPPAKATSNFHINLFRLRRALHPRIITMEQGRYQVNPNLEIWFDALEFEKLIKTSDNSALNDVELMPNLEKAVALYKGQFLADIYSDWAIQRRQELENEYIKALMLLARLSSNLGQHYRAIGLLERVIAIDLYQDEVYCQLIEEHLAMGNDIAATGIYKRYVDTVAHELDCVPSARMRKLYKRILSSGIGNN